MYDSSGALIGAVQSDGMPVLQDRALVVRMYQDTHDLAGALYGVSLCQQAFPHLLTTTRPWSFSGDRAPFI